MIQFYKPNPKVTGTACSFWINRDGSVMSSMIKQDSWNSDRKIGSFAKNKNNPAKRVITKLGRQEVAGIIDCLETNREFSTYHSSAKQVLQMKFCPYMRGGDQVGYSFSINKQDKEDSTAKTGFIIGFTFPEGRLLRHDLELFLGKTVNVKEDIEEQPAPTQTKEPRTVKVTDLNQEAVLENEDDDEPW
jgi:hypothetical protein